MVDTVATSIVLASVLFVLSPSIELWVGDVVTRLVYGIGEWDGFGLPVSIFCDVVRRWGFE